MFIALILFLFENIFRGEISACIFNCFPPYGSNITFDYDVGLQMMTISSRIVRGKFDQVSKVVINAEAHRMGKFVMIVFRYK